MLAPVSQTEGLVPVFDALCPMHALVDATGHIRHAGPALQKLMPTRSLTGVRLLELLELRRPKASGTLQSLLALSGQKLHLALRQPPRTELKGVIAALPEDVAGDLKGGLVINLSFGISIVDAVRDYALTGSDFAVTDLATEMLYLVEAKSAVMDELRRLNLRLSGARDVAEQQAFTDTLTGLGNRRAMDQAFEALLSLQRPFGLMHLDLDHFKAVNDTFGHAAGDCVLTTVSERLRLVTREGDIIIRQGGDEFIILLPGLTTERHLSDLAERLIAEIERTVPWEEQGLHVSASIGISVSSNYQQPDPEQMVADADKALYAVKEAGRNGFRLYTPSAADTGP